MTVTTDPGVDFWLEYVAAEGGLHERVGEATLVVLPEALQERHGRNAEMTVTADPDVAREDGAVLMTVGHPLLTAAAESILGEGDVGVVRLPRAGGRTPDLAQLQDWARDRITVDHGRVDLTGGPFPSVRHLVRVSSLATFTMSSDDRFQEQLECWVDLPSGLPIPVDAGQSMGALAAVEHAERGQLDPAAPGLARALIAVDDEISRRSELRRKALGDSVVPAYKGELDRARDYYEQTAISMRKRMATASPDKVEGYRARLAHCHAERDRRLTEIEEKYRSSVQFLPFRLHLVGVPTLRVEACIRRGNRRYPVDLEWLGPVRQFAPIACPGCGSGELLVAGKDGLGCRRCRPPRPLESVPAPVPAGRSATPAPAPRMPTPGPPTTPSKPDASGTPLAPSVRSAPTAAPKVAVPAGRPAAAAPTRNPEVAPPAVKSRAVEPQGASPSATATNATDRKRNAPVERRVQVRVQKPSSPAAQARAGGKLIVRLWERVERGDREVTRMCAPECPAAALARVYGPDGPRVALGVGAGVRLLNVASSPSVPVPGTDQWLTAGRLGATDRVDYPFQVLWHPTDGGPRIDEIVGVANGIWPWLPWRPQRTGTERGLWSAPLGMAAVAATRGDPVAALILGTTAECQGIAVAARCLAAWWRLDPPVAATLGTQGAPEVVAAALDKLVSRRAFTARRGDLEVGHDYDAEPVAVKAMAARLQRRLGLTAVQPW